MNETKQTHKEPASGYQGREGQERNNTGGEEKRITIRLYEIVKKKFFSIFSHPVAYRVPRPRIRSATAAMPDPLTHGTRPGIEATLHSNLSLCRRILNPLHHSTNSSNEIF